MKILWLASLLCAGFLSFAQIKSFEDLRGIDSKEAFIRVCLENGYQKSYYSDDKKLLYEYVKDEVRYTLKAMTLNIKKVNGSFRRRILRQKERMVSVTTIRY